MAKNRVIKVQGIPVTVSYEDIDDFICITDIAAAKSDNSRAADVIRNWLRNRSTLEFLSTWEEIYNPNFKVFESEHFKKEEGFVTFTPSVSEWVEKTNAVKEMLELIEAGTDDIDYVLVFKLSRFGRNAADVLSSLQKMRDFGVNLICVEDGIDSSKDAGKLIISSGGRMLLMMQ